MTGFLKEVSMNLKYSSTNPLFRFLARKNEMTVNFSKVWAFILDLKCVSINPEVENTLSEAAEDERKLKTTLETEMIGLTASAFMGKLPLPRFW